MGGWGWVGGGDIISLYHYLWANLEDNKLMIFALIFPENRC